MLQYQKLVQSAAWKAAKSCGLLNQIEDVIQEAWVAAMDALSRYNPEKGAPSTLIYSAVFFHTIKYYGKQQEFDTLPEDFDIPVSGNDYTYPLWYRELDSLQREIVDYTLTATERKTAIIRRFNRRYGSAKVRIAVAGIRRKLREVV